MQYPIPLPYVLYPHKLLLSLKHPWMPTRVFWLQIVVVRKIVLLVGLILILFLLLDRITIPIQMGTVLLAPLI